jgi:hypothetical protein
VSRGRKNPPSPPKSDDVLPCDGTAADYRRHSHRGEEPCPESREAWRIQCRLYRYTGIYDVPITDDPSQVHPFFYRKAKRNQQKRNGVYPGHKGRNKTRCPECKWMHKHHRDCSKGTK